MENLRRIFACISPTRGCMLIPRICAGASAGKTILPTAASNVPAQLRERLSAHKQPFRVRGRYSRRASGNRGPRFGATVRTSETSALALRVLRATAQYSICDFGVFCANLTHYVPVDPSIIKAAGYKLGRLTRLKEGSGSLSLCGKVALKSRFPWQKPRRKSLSFERTSLSASGRLNTAKSARNYTFVEKAL